MTITRILAANRGEIVSRVARTAHQRGIEVVAVYAASDEKAHYLADADLAYFLGDDANSSPYLDIDLLVTAARATGCDAVHPGFGFLAENAEFARAVHAAGLVWIGPPPAAIDAMGGKIAAKRVAAEAGVAVLESIELTDDVEIATKAAREVLSLPLLVKPSAGGGGKGMHRVDDFNDLPRVLAAAQREAKASFGDDTLFIERYLETARHVEVQVIADAHGGVVHLGTRDCSIQRRHQKIVEEAPAPHLDAALTEQMCTAAVDLARSIGYVGAGTVEYMVLGDEYAFLEMNTRLQVEHPVTEEVTGVDLVDLQITVARGDALPLAQSDVVLTGHSIEVRLYAEDPTAGFLPSPGTIGVFSAPKGDTSRWESGVASGSPVSSRYDPMIAKIIATGRDREEARVKLVRSLRGLAVSGVTTNRDMLVAVLGHDAFVAGALATRLLEDHPELALSRPPAEEVTVNAVAAVLADVVQRRAAATLQAFTPAGWRNVRSAPSSTALIANGEELLVEYAADRNGTWHVSVGGVDHSARIIGVRDDEFDLLVDDIRRRFSVRRESDGFLVSWAAGQTLFTSRSALVNDEALAVGALVAPLPGVVVAVERQVGDLVEAGDTLLIIEAMKMEHRVLAPESGRLSELHVKPGDPVEHDQLLAAVGAADDA